MRMIKSIDIIKYCLLIVCSGWGYGQQTFESSQKASLERIETIQHRKLSASTIAVEKAMPSTFLNTKENVIEDEYDTLFSFWEKVVAVVAPVSILHLGDSHIRGHIFSYEVRLLLESDFGDQAVEPLPINYNTTGFAVETGNPGIVYHCFGVNGATCDTFQNEQTLSEIDCLDPDLIILSFGTNEAHARNYSRQKHYEAMESLCETLKQKFPHAVFLLTSPAGAYFRSKRKTKIPNRLTTQVVQTQREFATHHKMAYWDLFKVAGGSQWACRNWLKNGAYQRDRIHFTQQGYQLQGRLLHEALIKSYNRYVELVRDR